MAYIHFEMDGQLGDTGITHSMQNYTTNYDPATTTIKLYLLNDEIVHTCENVCVASKALLSIKHCDANGKL